MWQALRAKEDARVYAELQSKQRAAYGDDEAAREAAGKAALLRAKESLSTGWRARLCYKQRVQKRMRNITPLVILPGSFKRNPPERLAEDAVVVVQQPLVHALSMQGAATPPPAMGQAGVRTKLVQRCRCATAPREAPWVWHLVERWPLVVRCLKMRTE